MSDNFGATPHDWETLAEKHELLPDLLPVVSNPNRPIAKYSSMKSVGKTPSALDSDGSVFGLAKWTERSTTQQELENWIDNPDLGICVQTRTVRALDVDVQDEEQAQEIREFIAEWLFGEDAVTNLEDDENIRYRDNSSKFLMPILVTEIEEEQHIGKCTVKTGETKGKKDVIEFLADGQQFVACGTHPSGERYQWSNGVEGGFTKLTLTQMAKLWDDLCEKFGVDEPTGDMTGGRARRRGKDHSASVTDYTLDQLEEQGLVEGYGSDGQAHIVCPFADGHTGGVDGSAYSSTSYFPAGTGGYAQGHFVCMHASCAHRTNGDFTDAFSITALPPAVADAMFEPVELGEDDLNLPVLKRHKDGEILSTDPNLFKVLIRPDLCGVHIGEDGYTEEIMWLPYSKGTRNCQAKGECCWGSLWQDGNKSEMRVMTDEDITRLRTRLQDELGFKPISATIMREQVQLVAVENRFDSMKNYCAGLEWDGVKRVEKFFTHYVPCADPEEKQQLYKDAANYLFTAIAGRSSVGGVKADIVPIFYGAQGIGKSTGIAALAPHWQLAVEIGFTEKEKAQSIRGKFIAEFGELRGLFASALEEMKSFVTRTADRYRPLYKNQWREYPRRNVFIGSTNHPEILSDNTGNRRLLPMHVVGKVLVDGIKQDREQLLAEGIHLFKKHGVMYQALEQNTTLDEHKLDYETQDPWEEPIERFLQGADTEGRKYVDILMGKHAKDKKDPITGLTNEDFFIGAVHIPINQINSAHTRKLSEILRKKGLQYRQKRDRRGVRSRLWVDESLV